MTTVGKAQKRISKHTVCEYKLCFANEEYSIVCTEYGNDGEVKDFSLVKSFTSAEMVAKEIFQKIVRYRVSACTLYDIISDLIC